MIRTTKHTAVFTEAEYQAIRTASQRGMLSAVTKFERDQKSGEVTLVTKSPKKMCEQMERVVDFGACTAYEILVA